MLLGAPLSAALVGGIVWAVARFGLEVADQTASVVGGTAGVLGLAVSLYALRGGGSGGGGGGTPGGTAPAREWVSSAAVRPSLRPPAPGAPVRGREREIARLDALSRSRDGGMAVVCGAGGLGKTTLAMEVAGRAQRAGRAVFCVRWRDEPARLAEELSQIAQDLGLSEARLIDAQTGRAALVDVVWEQLASVRGWVIVVDNVDTPARVGPEAEPVSAYRGWLRPDGGGLLLVTSRDSDTVTWGARATVLHLDPLGDRASGQVLLDAAPGAGTPEEAEALGARLGGLPLALEAAGRYLAAPTSRFRTFTAYRDALSTEFGDLLGAEHPRAADPETARTVVRHTWDLSLDQLARDGLPLARPLLRLLALLEPAPLPRTLITPALLTDATGEPATAAGVDAALAGLHRYGLLGAPQAAVPDEGVGRLVLHPLVREVTALSATGTDLTPWYAALDRHLIQAVEDTVRSGRAGWPTARLLALHLPALLDRAPAEEVVTARAPLDDLAHVLDAAGASAERLLLHRRVLDAETAHLGPDHPDTLASRNNLAGTLGELGHRQEAADLHRETLTASERILGPDHPGTLNSRNNLATTLHHLGHHQEAADLHRETLTASERILGPDHPGTLNSRNNLAAVLNELGHHQEAAELHRRTLTTRERVLGPNHPDTLTSRNNLASTLHNLGHHQEAAELHRRTLTTREHVLGPNHPDTLTTRNNLADTLYVLGHLQEAAELHRRTLTTREHVLGPNHPDTLTSRNNLASTLYNLGHHQEAADLLRETLAAQERVLGPDHPHTMGTRDNLTLVEAAIAERHRRRWRRRRR
ncbi:FxSxx-COOH system tetratricopeptide repeat protein [Streptomyces sp. LP05-1]|uniref:FxSxx-COOH system tetratricopeptide repeat protein n=1 Tax=Streptomyces pyxinae TaxID=2970734 RepID=A0ABT2CLN3_9ACTN|nr:FxSxx-COOH system tetratricopeptide repeat protein [Streptomyces sp. LP05-1]MCS0638337.1 FxSxx-COOH system tetratricopeptide repeat protein [Streptomyces sp. LP05-1]